MSIKSWSVQDDKARFSELLDAGVKHGPQVVTRRGAQTAVLVAHDEWRRLCHGAKLSLKALLLSGIAKSDLRDPARGQGRRRVVPAL